MAFAFLGSVGDADVSGGFGGAGSPCRDDAVAHALATRVSGTGAMGVPGVGTARLPDALVTRAPGALATRLPSALAAWGSRFACGLGSSGAVTLAESWRRGYSRSLATPAVPGDVSVPALLASAFGGFDDAGPVGAAGGWSAGAERGWDADAEGATAGMRVPEVRRVGGGCRRAVGMRMPKVRRPECGRRNEVGTPKRGRRAGIEGRPGRGAASNRRFAAAMRRGFPSPAFRSLSMRHAARS